MKKPERKHVLQVMVTRETFTFVKAEAKRDGRTLSGWLNRQLEAIRKKTGSREGVTKEHGKTS